MTTLRTAAQQALESSMTPPKIYRAYLNQALLNQTIYALLSRVNDLNGRPDLDNEALVHTDAALKLFRDIREGKEQP